MISKFIKLSFVVLICANGAFALGFGDLANKVKGGVGSVCQKATTLVSDTEASAQSTDAMVAGEADATIDGVKGDVVDESIITKLAELTCTTQVEFENAPQKMLFYGRYTIVLAEKANVILLCSAMEYMRSFGIEPPDIEDPIFQVNNTVAESERALRKFFKKKSSTENEAPAQVLDKVAYRTAVLDAYFDALDKTQGEVSTKRQMDAVGTAVDEIGVARSFSGVSFAASGFFLKSLAELAGDIKSNPTEYGLDGLAYVSESLKLVGEFNDNFSDYRALAGEIKEIEGALDGIDLSRVDENAVAAVEDSAAVESALDIQDDSDGQENYMKEYEEKVAATYNPKATPVPNEI